MSGEPIVTVEADQVVVVTETVPPPGVADVAAAVDQARQHRDDAQTAKNAAQAVLLDSAFQTVVALEDEITTVAMAAGSVVAVAQNAANINAVAGAIANVNAVAADLVAINAVHANAADIDAVAADLANVDAVAGGLANVNTVAGASANVNAVAGSIVNVNAVAADLANVDTAAANIAAVNEAATNMPAIVAAPTHAAAAAQSETNAQASEEAAGNFASLALAVYGTSADLNAAQQIMMGYANTAQAQANLAASSAASASSVLAQDLSAISAQLHFSPNAITALFPYNVDRDTDPSWPDRCQNTSWYQEAPNGTWLPGGFASEMDARDYFGAIGQTSVVTGDSSTFTNGVGAWTSLANGTVTAPSGRLRITQTGALGTITTATLAMTTVAGQRYQVSLDYAVATTSAQNLWYSVGTSSGGAQIIAATNFGNAAVGRRLVSFVATGTTTYFSLQGTVSWATGVFVEIDDFTVKPVSFATNPSGAFFQNSADGKFYRLWKNRAALSEQFDQASWTKTNLTPTANADGTEDLLVENSAAGFHSISPVGLNQVTGTVNAIHIRAKPAGRTWMYVQIGTLVAYVNLSGAGAVGTVGAGLTATCTQAVDQAGYYDVVVYGVANSTVGNFGFATGDLGANYTGDGASGMYIQRAHCEIGGYTGYEQRTTADVGQSETFRGNKRKFPRPAAIVAEAARTVIYDPFEAGRPMWMVFNSGASIFDMLRTSGVVGIDAKNGVIGFALGSSMGLAVIDFMADAARSYTATAGWGYYQGNIAQRNSAKDYKRDRAALLANNTVNAVAMTVRPNAPVDPVTGLQIPVIAVAVGTGSAGSIGSVIMEDGSVVNYSQPGNDGTSVAFNARNDLLWGFSGSTGVFNIPLQASNVSNISGHASCRTYGASTAPSSGAGGRKKTIGGATLATMVQEGAGAARVVLLRENVSAPGSGLAAQIEPTYATGWMTGAILRCLLASIDAGTVAGTNLLTNGTFDTDLAAWTAYQPGTSTAVWSAGTAAITGDGTNTAYLSQAFATVVGRVYGIRFDVATNAVGACVGTTDRAQNVVANTTYNPGASQPVVFTATSTTTYLSFFKGSAVTANVDNISVKEVVADRSYKNKPATVYGTLTKTAVATAAQLMFFSGWSATNYAQEAYSSDLDFGTGEWSVSAAVSIPATLPAASFPGIGSEIFPALDFTTGSDAGAVTGKTANTFTTSGGGGIVFASRMTIGKTYRVQITGNTTGGNFRFRNPVDAVAGTYASGSGSFSIDAVVSWASSTSAYFYVDSAATVTITSITVKEAGISCVAERAAATGPYIKVGVLADGKLAAEAYDGTTTRRVTSTAAYNTATPIKVRANYQTSGTLSLQVNGDPAGSTTGSPLLTLTNASAVLTIGNSRTLDAPFPGSIALLKIGATVPTDEQSKFMYAQESRMFQASAQCCLPASTAVVDMAYDDALDLLTVKQAAYQSQFHGLVRVASAAPSAGSFTKTATRGGVRLAARSTTNPGVDVVIPAYGLREELVNRSEAAARLARLDEPFNYSGGFTANTTNGSTALASVAGWTYPDGVNPRGAVVKGTGIPAGAYITDVVGTTVYISAPATATGTGVQIALTDFPLPVGFEAKSVLTDGVQKQEGATKAYTKRFDGFRETPRYGTEPGYAAWVQIKARRTTQ